MHQLIPVKAFECSDLPVLAVDKDGVVRFTNEAAANLFVPGPDPILGQHCWKFTRFRTADGEPLCGRDCPIRGECCRGPVQALRQVILPPTGSATPLRFDLLTFMVPPAPSPDCTILHFLIPALEPARRPATPDEARGLMTNSRLHLLTARELEVLELLATSLDPAAVADRLNVSLATVRNHIHSILQKLHLHRQVDAILSLLDSHGGLSPAIRG